MRFEPREEEATLVVVMRVNLCYLNPAKVDRSLEHTTIWHTHTHTHTHSHTHTHIYIYIWETLLMPFPLSPFFRGRRQGRQPLNPARGPLAVALPYGGSLLSVGERGCTPCRRPTWYLKNCRVLRCFVLFSFLAVFRILWPKMGQHGPT